MSAPLLRSYSTLGHVPRSSERSVAVLESQQLDALAALPGSSRSALVLRHALLLRERQSHEAVGTDLTN